MQLKEVVENIKPCGKQFPAKEQEARAREAEIENLMQVDMLKSRK